MFKAIANIILSLLILVSSTSLTIDKHYCKNEVKSIGIFNKAESCCKAPCKCCHNETVTIKKTVEDYSFSTADFNFNTFSVDFVNVWQNIKAVLLPTTVKAVLNNISPHEILISTFKLICVFRL